MEKVTFLERVTGTNDFPFLAAVLVFALTGVVISLLIHASNRKPDSYTSPRKFSFGYLIRDNWKRVLLDILLVLVTIRFSQEITGLKLSEFTALLIGISFDKIAEWLQNKKILIGKS